MDPGHRVPARHVQGQPLLVQARCKGPCRTNRSRTPWHPIQELQPLQQLFHCDAFWSQNDPAQHPLAHQRWYQGIAAWLWNTCCSPVPQAWWGWASCLAYNLRLQRSVAPHWRPPDTPTAWPIGCRTLGSWSWVARSLVARSLEVFGLETKIRSSLSPCGKMAALDSGAVLCWGNLSVPGPRSMVVVLGPLPFNFGKNMASVKLWAVCLDIKNLVRTLLFAAPALANTIFKENAFASIWQNISITLWGMLPTTILLIHKSIVVKGVECWTAKHTSALLQDQVFFGQKDVKRKLTCQKINIFVTRWAWHSKLRWNLAQKPRPQFQKPKPQLPWTEFLPTYLLT